MSIRLADYGLRAMTPDDWHAHDLLIIRCRSRWLDGYRRTLPKIRRVR